jgi:hypothetical protein
VRQYWHFLGVLVLASQAVAEWTRYVGEATGERIDSSPAFSLSHFRGRPCTQNDPDGPLFRCGSPTSRAYQTGARTTLQTVGRIDGFTIYDLRYFSSGETEPGQRSVLVRIGADDVHEIHARENAIGGTFYPIKIIAVAQQPMVEVKWDDGGNAHSVHEDYLLLRKTGAILLDFAPVVNAAKRSIPADMVTYQPTSRFDLNALMYSVGAFRRDSPASNKLACCTGRVDVHFQIANGRVVPGQSTYIAIWP